MLKRYQEVYSKEKDSIKRSLYTSRRRGWTSRKDS